MPHTAPETHDGKWRFEALFMRRISWQPTRCIWAWSE